MELALRVRRPVPTGPYPGTDWTVLDDRQYVRNRRTFLYVKCACGRRLFRQRLFLVSGRSRRCVVCENRKRHEPAPAGGM